MDIDNFSKKVLLTFTKNDDIKEMALNREFNEVGSYRSGFIISNVDKVQIGKMKDNTIGIFLYKNKELIAKDFIFESISNFSKENKQLIFYQELYDNKETHHFRFEII